MQWTLLTKDDFVTTRWSGGTTTQLAIEPPEAVYADRNFLWRLSTARVEDEHSDFTPLPDYNRLLTVLDSEISLQEEGKDRFTLMPGTVFQFDGGVHVQSWGTCNDFNLMLRKGKASGEMQWLAMNSGEEQTAGSLACDFIMVWCLSGALSLKGSDLTAAPGTLLLGTGPAEELPVLRSHGKSTGIAVWVQLSEQKR